MSRYDTLLQLIRAFRPQTIVETGTYNGQNAIRMLQTMRMYTNRPKYIGYDLFEDATAETDTEEFNVKQHWSVEKVESRIRRQCPWAEICLVKGNTRQTLMHVTADLAYIDGGHSLETVRHDYEMLKSSKVIVLDDYYRADENGRMPDISVMGCNDLLKNIPHAVIETGDRIEGDNVDTGGIVNLAVCIGGA